MIICTSGRGQTNGNKLCVPLMILFGFLLAEVPAGADWCQIAYAASEFTPLSGTAWGNGGAVTANYQHTHFTLAMKR